MRRAVLGTCGYLLFALLLLLWLPIMAFVRLTTAKDPTRRKSGAWMRRFGRVMTRINPMWDVRVEGDIPNDIHHRAYVVVSNHESWADPFLMSFLPWDMRWIGKEELWRAPLVGWMFRLSGDIPVRRGDRASVERMHDQCLRTLRNGLPVILFPEGTRSRDGNLLPFKEGAFRLALEAGVPVLPIVLHGTRNCMPKGSYWPGEAHATIRVLPPIEITNHSVDSLRDETRTRVVAGLETLRAEGTSTQGRGKSAFMSDEASA